MQTIATAAFGVTLDKTIGFDRMRSGDNAAPIAPAANAARLGLPAGKGLLSGCAVAHGFEDVGHACTSHVELAGAVGAMVVGTGLARRRNGHADAGLG